MPLRIGSPTPVVEPIVLPFGLDHLSASSIDTYLRCPMQWYYRYVMGLKQPPAIALEFGSCGHEALKFNNQFKFEKKEDLPTNVVLDKFSDVLSTRKKDIEDWGEGGKEKSYDIHQNLGREFLSDYMRDFAGQLTPDKMPEERRHVNIAGVKIEYVMDLQAGGEGIDYKFVNTKKNNNDVKNSVQSWTYSYAEKFTKMNMISFAKKTGEIAFAEADITPADHAWLHEIVKKVAESLKTGVFHPRNPGGMEWWVCTPKFCGYWDRCRGAK